MANLDGTAGNINKLSCFDSEVEHSRFTQQFQYSVSRCLLIDAVPPLNFIKHALIRNYFSRLSKKI